MAKKFRCTVCGYIHEGDAAPEKCPLCKVPAEKFVEIEEKQGERYLNLLDSYYSFINEFPESKRRKELERYIKEAKDYLDKNNIEKQQ